MSPASKGALLNIHYYYLLADLDNKIISFHYYVIDQNTIR